MNTFQIQCPYCHASQSAEHPGGYAPVYVNCSGCGNRFILEPARHGAKTYRTEDAPCCSDPECRSMEMGLGDD